jgi:hypothetical protein
MIKIIQLSAGLLLLMGVEFLNGQKSPQAGATQSEISTFIADNIHYLRLIGVLMIFYPVIYYFKFGNRGTQYSVGIALLVYLTIVIIMN